MRPFTIMTFRFIHKMIEDLLTSVDKDLSWAQFQALTKIFNSDTLSTLMHRYISTEELLQYLKFVQLFVPKILTQDEIHKKLNFTLVNQKATAIKEIFPALKNIVKKYKSQLSESEVSLKY